MGGNVGYHPGPGSQNPYLSHQDDMSQQPPMETMQHQSEHASPSLQHRDQQQVGVTDFFKSLFKYAKENTTLVTTRRHRQASFAMSSIVNLE